MLRQPKVLAIVIGTIVLLVVGFLFLRAPIAHIQLASEEVTRLGGYSVRNTYLATWLTMLLLIALSFFATRKMDLVPRGLQNFMELIIEGFLGFAETVAGRDKARRFFPLAATIFLLILLSNWLGLLPGFGTVGVVEPAEKVIEHAKEKGKPLGEERLLLFNTGSPATMPLTGEKQIAAEEYEHRGAPPGQVAGLLVPFLRSANTDLNTPLAMALVAIFMVEFWGIRSLGLFGYGSRFFNFGPFLKGLVRLKPGAMLNGAIEVFVGLLEVFSELGKIVSLTFRLFGNIFAGEVLIAAITFLIPLVIVLPFFGLELFVGFVQALVFATLTLVFAAMATTAHGGEEAGAKHHQAADKG